ncbi:MAG: putative dehydrogenase [Verrucomicrobiales bacterium]|jgi:predicted dehydrogenase
MQTSKTSRRHFLKNTTAASAVAFPYIGWKSTASGQAPSKDLRFVNFGGGGRAWGDLTSMNGVPNTTAVAVAEIDTTRHIKIREAFPKTKVYQDWRQMLEEVADQVDVAVVGTPDHMHAPMAMSSMQLGLHTYCEKPLTRTLHECRTLTEYAVENNLKTQMGIQVSSSSGNRTASALLRAEVVGKVKSVHSMNPKSWGSMSPLPDGEDPVPEGLNWDNWCGVSPLVPFKKNQYHPGNWRKRIGFGTGTLGDMACHIVHPWFHGLKAPTAIGATQHGEGPVDGDSWPLNAHVAYRMKGNDMTEGDFDFVWYDGNKFPGEDVIASVGEKGNVPRSGTVVIGTTGAVTIPHGGGAPTIYRNGKKTDEKYEAVEGQNHHGNFADSIREDISDLPLASFEYAGPMTEVVLLGTVAMRHPGVALDWDSEALKFTNSDSANKLVREPYRKGWEVEGL